MCCRTRPKSSSSKPVCAVALYAAAMITVRARIIEQYCNPGLSQPPGTGSRSVNVDVEDAARLFLTSSLRRPPDSNLAPVGSSLLPELSDAEGVGAEGVNVLDPSGTGSQPNTFKHSALRTKRVGHE